MVCQHQQEVHEVWKIGTLRKGEEIMIKPKKDRTDPEVRKEMYKDYLCPECGEPPELTCKCMRRDAKCKNGHWWHTCTAHHKIVSGQSDHGKSGCTCLTKVGDDRVRCWD